MNRRQLIASTGAGFATVLAGRSASAGFEPDVDPLERLGGAPPVSTEVTAERDFGETAERSSEERATRRASDHATERLRAILGRESLTGAGVSIGQGALDLDELDRPSGAEPPGESEFRRAVEIGPRVFHYRHYSRDGELLSKPEVAFRAIVDATPRSFEGTMNHPEGTYVAVLPALCRRGWIQNT